MSWTQCCRASCSLLFCAVFLSSPVRCVQAKETVSEVNTEARVVRAFEEARKGGTPALRAFLFQMPKGADLHMHLAGAVYAESLIRAAGEDGLCADTAKLAFVKAAGSVCAPATVPVASLPQSQELYGAFIDAFSMRAFVPITGHSGHDHFFQSFDKFEGIDPRHNWEWIDEVATRAAAQNEQYLELMDTPNFVPVATLAAKVGYSSDFARYRKLLLAQGFRNYIPETQTYFDQADAARREREHCGKPDSQPACRVEIHYIYQVLRGLPKEAVFAQILLGFELASTDPHVVGLNLVQPEDCYTCMTDYRLHMQMIEALRVFYPNVHISLHAGELEQGMVPPNGLSFHIRSAVERGHAERIGHGVDVMYEDRPYDLLKEMAARHIMVEVNLTSNDVILNVKGGGHPFMLYRKYGVPVALSTDDEGVSRIDLTNEYVRAATDYPLSYRDFKLMVRTSIEHSFLHGTGIWQTSTPEKLDTPVVPCRRQLGGDTPSGVCAKLIQSSEKAQQEWELERRFRVFEEGF